MAGSFAHLTTLASTSAEHKGATPPPRPPIPPVRRSYDCGHYLLICSFQGGVTRGGRGQQECVDLTLLPANDTIDAALKFCLKIRAVLQRFLFASWGSTLFSHVFGSEPPRLHFGSNCGDFGSPSAVRVAV